MEKRAKTPSSRVLSSYAPTPSNKMLNNKIATSLHTQRERLISQQGLNLVMTATSKGQGTRLVRDKRYFLGELQVKVGQLEKELTNIAKELDQNAKELASFAVYDRRVKQMAQDLTEMQGILADNNMAIDKINTGSDSTKMILEAKELVMNNDTEVHSLETLFTDRIRRQEAIREIEEQINKEKYKTEHLLVDMGRALREQYNQLTKEVSDYTQKVASLQSELNSLDKTKSFIGDQVYISPGKIETVQLELKLWELERKREALNQEFHSNSSPEEQRSALLNQLKQDNAQLATIKKATSEIQEHIRQAESALSPSQKVSEESTHVRQAKYLELKKREETIEEFLSNVESLKEDELSKLEGLSREIFPILKVMAAKTAVVPTAADYKFLDKNSTPATADVLNTTKSIGTEHRNLSRYLSKVEVMDKQIDTELASLNSKMETMRAQLASFANTVELESEIESKRISLSSEKGVLESARPKTKVTLKLKTNNFNDIQRSLIENEEQAQIRYSEKRLSNLEQTNYTMRDYLEESRCVEDMEASRTKALNSVQRLNVFIRNGIK